MRGANAMGEATQPRVRMEPRARRDLLRGTAREVFADRGYAASGLAEIAERAGVDKRLLYYYYPDGRSGLFTAVVAEVTAELTDVIHVAVSPPANTTRRVERLVEALIGFFEDQPDAFSLLFRDPFGVRDHKIVLAAVQTQIELAKGFSKLFAASGVQTPTLQAVTSGTVSFVVQVIEMTVRQEIDREAAVDACMTCVLGVMTQMGVRKA